MKKNLDINNTMSMLEGMQEQTRTSRKKQRETKPFKKPSADYYNLDMVVRKTVKGPKGHPVLSEEIKTDYKDYIMTMASDENMSITKYLHRLIDQDMKKHKARYNELKQGG